MYLRGKDRSGNCVRIPCMGGDGKGGSAFARDKAVMNKMTLLSTKYAILAHVLLAIPLVFRYFAITTLLRGVL